MDSFDSGSDSEKILVSLRSNLHDRAVEVRLPSGITVTVGYLCACKLKESFYLVGDIPFAGLDRTALACGNKDFVVIFHLHRCEVG